MSLFIQSAHAAETAASPNGFIQLLPMVAIFIFFYFMIIRPQTKRNKEHRNLIDGLSVADEVIFAGGLMGVVKAIDGEYAVISLNANNHIKIQKSSVISVLPKGTIENLG